MSTLKQLYETGIKISRGSPSCRSSQSSCNSKRNVFVDSEIVATDVIAAKLQNIFQFDF